MFNLKRTDMKLEFNTSEFMIGDLNFNIESLRESLNNDYMHSSEAYYWKKRSKNKFKKIESYRSFSNNNNRKQHIRLCENRFEFKKSKRWYGYEDKYMDYRAYTYEESGLKKVTPYRNKVYCPCCSKYKIVFSEKNKADNFIKFNSASILEENGYAPIRSYYCTLCGGWHVTSLEENHLKQTGKEFCLAERVVMNLVDKHCCEQYNKSEPIKEVKSTEEYINELIKDIKLSFNKEMETFFIAYRNKELKRCKEIHSKMKDMFLNCQLHYKEIDLIKKRILDAQINIDKLSSLLLKEENEKRMLIWSIQQLFKDEYDKFKHAYALKKLGDCRTIYIKTAKAIYESGINLPFIIAIKKKLTYMEQCIKNLIDLGCRSKKELPSIQNYNISYLNAV